MVASLLLWSLAVAQITATTAPAATAAAAPAAGTPERAYADFTTAVRTGKVDEALKLSMPVGAANRAFFAAQFRMLHEIESLKFATIRKFPGEDQDAERVMANSGMVSAAVVATAQAKVEGDRARLTLIPPDSRQREATEINLARVGGAWLVSPFDASGPGLSDDEEKEALADAAKVTRETAEYEAIAKQIAALRPRLEKGEFADADAVVGEMMRIAIPR